MDRDTSRRQRHQNQGVTYAPVFRWDDRGEKWFKYIDPFHKEWSGIQFTESEGHRASHDGKYREGGPFFTYRIQPQINTRHLSHEWKEYAQINGPIHVPLVPENMGGFKPPTSDSSHLNPIGAEAIHIVDPTNPNANVASALGEILKDRKLPIPGIPTWKRRTELAKAAGSEYLNAEFGWKPLVRDMQDTARAVRDGNTILENYSNASGTNVHREFEFPPIESVTTDTVQTNGQAVYHAQLSIGPTVDNNNQVVTKTRKSQTRRWFSGAFTYSAGNRDGIGAALGIGSEADKLLGLSLTPDVVWELTPWSWAVDWFSNADACISNATSLALAGLVMRYGYIMEETSIHDTYSMPGTGLKGVAGSVPSSSVTYTVKRRAEANPFGFGLSWDGLSPTQLAITAALGITHLR